VASAIHRSSVLAVLAAGALACATGPKPTGAPPASATPAPSAGAPAAVEAPRAPNAPSTGLVFAVEPADAQIAIDGAPHGTVADLAAQGGLLPLAPGIYQVSLKAPGYATWRAEVALGASNETIRVNLVKRP
jgi:hypothetical protein